MYCKYLIQMPGRGLEPPRCYPLVPETSASTNSATRAGEEGSEMYAGVRGLSIDDTSRKARTARRPREPALAEPQPEDRRLQIQERRARRGRSPRHARKRAR